MKDIELSDEAEYGMIRPNSTHNAMMTIVRLRVLIQCCTRLSVVLVAKVSSPFEPK